MSLLVRRKGEIIQGISPNWAKFVEEFREILPRWEKLFFFFLCFFKTKKNLKNPKIPQTNKILQEFRPVERN